MNLAVITHASKPNENRVLAVLECLKLRGLTHFVYGNGTWRWFGDKLLTAYKAARELTLYTHLLFIDARDVAVLAGQDELLDVYLSFGHPFVCSAEANCWPVPSKADRYPPSPHRWRYLNSGAYLAERLYLKDFLEKRGGNNIDPKCDDQLFLTDAYLNDPACLILDIGCRLFQSMIQSEADLELSQRKVLNKTTGTSPLVLHNNGGNDIIGLRHVWG